MVDATATVSLLGSSRRRAFKVGDCSKCSSSALGLVWTDDIGPFDSQPYPSLFESRPYGSDPVTVTGPVYLAPSPDPPAQSWSGAGGKRGE
jgi:hypothetical protein